VNKAVKSFGAPLTAHVTKQVEKLGHTFSTMAPQQQLLLLQTAKEGARDLTPADVSEALKLKEALKTGVPENKLTKQRDAEKESASIAEDNTQSNTLAEALLAGNTEAYVPLLEVLGGKNGFLVRQALRSRFGMPGSMNTPQAIADYFVGASAKVSAAEASQRASALAEGKALWENTKGAGSWESLSLAQQAEFSVDAVEHADSPQVLEHLKGAYHVEDRTVSQERGEAPGAVSASVESPSPGSVGLSRREEGERGTSGKGPSVSVKKKPTVVREAVAPDEEQFERLLRNVATKEESSGDVLLGDGRFVPFQVAVDTARQAIDSGAMRPFPAQMNLFLGMAMRDADRVLAAAKSYTHQEVKDGEPSTKFSEVANGDESITLEAPTPIGDDFESAQAAFLSAFPKSSGYHHFKYGKNSTSRDARAASEVAQRDIDLDPLVGRDVAQPLGAFSGYVTRAQVGTTLDGKQQ
jgi:hypothetical protein